MQKRSGFFVHRAEMNTRIFQEVRLIFWPWCLMTLAGLVPLVKEFFIAGKRSDWPEGVAILGFFGGSAILTAISFRNALRTGPPSLWSDKMTVLMVATGCSALIAVSAQLAVGAIALRELNANVIEPILLLVIIVCSTGFWTLMARSVVGGLALAAAAQFVLYLLLVLFARTIDRMLPGNPDGVRLSHQPGIHPALSWFVGGFGLAYAAFMLWLGRNRFAKIGLQAKSVGVAHLSSA